MVSLDVGKIMIGRKLSPGVQVLESSRQNIEEDGRKRQGMQTWEGSLFSFCSLFMDGTSLKVFRVTESSAIKWWKSVGNTPRCVYTERIKKEPKEKA